MHLFDDFQRDDDSLAGYCEPHYVFLNRTARDGADRLRTELETWFARYPQEHKVKLSGDFRSRDNRQHLAAFFELLLYEFLRRLGCRVEVHPELLHTTNRPEFLVTQPDGTQFYLEATIATYESDEEAGARKRINQVYDVLNRRIKTTDFYLWLEVDGAPETQPPARELAHFLNQKLQSIDPDDLAAAYESGGPDTRPCWSYEHSGWKITFRPIPKKPEVRDRPTLRPIGMVSGIWQLQDHRTPLRDALVNKAARYGITDLPFIVAVNAMETIDDIDIMEALFGREQWHVSISDTDVPPVVSRVPDGLWTGTGGPRNINVSAVLLCKRLVPWSICQFKPRLYHNPWATIPYDGVMTQLPQSVPQNGRMISVDGRSICSIFGFEDQWPFYGEQ